MDTGDGIGIGLSGQWVILVNVSTCVEANCGFIGPLKLTTLVRVDSVGLGTIGNHTSLEGVGLEETDSVLTDGFTISQILLFSLL